MSGFPKISAVSLAAAIGIPSLGAVGVICALKLYHSRQKSVQISEATNETSSHELNFDTKTDTGAKINVAVIGCCGSGKSYLISALRKVDNMDAKVASMCNTGDTSQSFPVSYPDPNNSHLIYWEIPDAAHIMDDHLYDDFHKFDCLIVLLGNRFMKLDLDCIREAQKLDIPVVVVRSKTDVDIENEIRWQHDADIEEIKSSLKYRITKNVTNELLSADLRSETVLLVSSLVFNEQSYSNKYAMDEIDLVDFINELIDSDA